MTNENPTLRENKYWLINPFANLFAGMATGYALEKNGMPYSAVDLGLQVSVPVGLGSLEFLVKKYVKNQDDIQGNTLAGSSALGVATFNGGNYAGRFLAK